MNKKGFTLIELLAVIVILAIIALIATPTILGVIEKARKGATKNSALGYIDAIEKQVAIDMLTGESFLSDGLHNIDGLNLSLKGKPPTAGNIIVTNGIVTKGFFEFDKYYVCYVDNETQLSKDKEELTDCSDIVEGVLYKETILNGTDPVLSNNLIPVIIANDGTVTKASLYNSWYNYENKVWANAVILKDETVSYETNEIIPEENIESYFVWIPRYKYQLFYPDNYSSVISEVPTESNAQTINIVFESKDTEVSIGTLKDEWLTHPAFTTFDTNGIWVGKFELTGTSSDVTVKPGIISLRSLTVKTIFETLYNYNRDLNSHMMKNTEWGAVAYLSHSVYGINSEVNINNNSGYLTGYSAVEGTDQSSSKGTNGKDSSVTLAYNTTTGYKASTTGNISGIYDMSGGAHEYMAAYRDETYGSSGFDATTIAEYDSKYFDVYPSDSTTISYMYRILGDATGEIGPFYYYEDSVGNSDYRNAWYEDRSTNPYYALSWFMRGGHNPDGAIAGQFSFNSYNGDVGLAIGSRLVLTN